MEAGRGVDAEQFADDLDWGRLARSSHPCTVLAEFAGYSPGDYDDCGIVDNSDECDDMDAVLK